MTLTVGSVDYTPYVTSVAWKEETIQGSNAGIAISGRRYIDRIATKAVLNITFAPMSQTDAQIVLSALWSEYISVSYDDPSHGTRSGVSFYCTNAQTKTLFIDNGTMWYTEVSCTLEER